MAELNDAPNYVNMFSQSFAAGRDMAKQKGIQNALSMAPTDPTGAAAALTQYGEFQGANALMQNAASQRALKVQQDVAPKVQAGNYSGAAQDAAAQGQYDLSGQLSKLDETQRAHAAQTAEIIGKAAYGLAQVPPEQRAAKLQSITPLLIQQGVSEDMIAKADLSDQGLAQLAGQAMTVKDQIAAHQKDQEITNTADNNKALRAQAAAQAAETARHNRADEGTAAGNLAVNRDKLKLMSSGGGMTPEDLDFYAQKYARDGTLPQLQGPSGTMIKSQILSRSAQMQRGQGQTGADFATTVAGTKANSAALTDQAKKAAQINTLERTANDAGDLALQLAKEGGAGPSAALFNRPIQAIRSNLSDPQVAAFNQALGTFRDEYAAVASKGGAPTDALRHDIDSRLNRAQSVAELEKVVAVMRKEMAFRDHAQVTTQTDLRGQIHGGPASQGAAPSAAQGAKPSLQSIFGH